MDFVKEFATFLYEKEAIKFGDFTLASGKKSSYYIDLRIVPSFPHQFRKMVKHLQNEIIKTIGLENFNSLVSVPTGGLIIASALAIETVKPLIYVRTKPKKYGTTKMVEGHVEKNMQVLMIDDVATTGGSVINAIKSLKDEGIKITDAFVIINRMEGASENLQMQGVKMHQISNIMEITQILFEEKLVSKEILEKVKMQTSS